MADMDTNVRVRFAGNRPIDWHPDGTGISSPQKTDPRFHAFVSEQLQEVMQDTQMPAAERAEQVKWVKVVLDRAEDPNGRIVGATSDRNNDASVDDTETRFNIVLNGLITLLRSGTAPWAANVRREAGEGPASSRASRESADRKVQKEVPQLYGNRCILTGTTKPQAAHIVPARAKHANHRKTWELLVSFWPLGKCGDVSIDGKEHINILPLTHTAHALFDAFHFALRPIAHPHTPDTHIFLQLVWLRDPEGNRVSEDWDHQRFGGLFDFRRRNGHRPHDDSSCPVLRHGDVYELATDDPISHPLPSERLLQIQFGLHQLMSGMRAAGSLRSIFARPPDDQDEDDTNVPVEWAQLLEDAQELGVIDRDAAGRWGKEFARQAREDAEMSAMKEVAFRREQLGLDPFDEEDRNEDTGGKGDLKGKNKDNHDRPGHEH